MKQRNLIQAIVVFLVLATVVFLTIDQTLPPKALPASAPISEFSAERAIEHLKVIATEPRLVGEPGFEDARDYIIEELTKLGLSLEIQRTRNDSVENIIARFEGTETKEAILLVAHLDTTGSSPGATDDGHGVAVLLETARALRAGPPLQNTVMLLFSAPEETGAQGARAFYQEHTWIEDVNLVVNFDAGGLTGPAALTGRSADHGWLINEAAKADPYFFGTSATGEGKSDFTLAFRPAGFSGYDFQYTWDRRIHSPDDNLDNLNPSSLQHQGYHALSLARHFGNLNSLEDPKDPDPIYFNFLRLGVVQYPATWVTPIMLLVVLIFTSAIVLGFRRKALTPLGIGLGVLVFVISAIGTPFLVSRLSPQLPKVFPKFSTIYFGYGANELLLIMLFASFSLALTTTLYALMKKIRQVSMPDLTIGAFALVALITVIAAIDSPEASFVFAWPGLFGFLAVGYWFYSTKIDSNSFSIGQLVALVFAAVVAIAVMVPAILDDFMISQPNDWFLPLLQLVMLWGLLMPLLQIITRPNKWWLPVVAWVATTIIIIVALLG